MSTRYRGMSVREMAAPYLELLRRRARRGLPRHPRWMLWRRGEGDGPRHLDCELEVASLLQRDASFGFVACLWRGPSGSSEPRSACLLGGAGDVELARKLLAQDPGADWYWCDPAGIEGMPYELFEVRLEAWGLGGGAAMAGSRSRLR